MDTSRWERIQQIFHQALELPEPRRQSFVESAAEGDSEIIAEVMAMLHYDGQDASLLDVGLHAIADQLVGDRFDAASLKETGPYEIKELLGEGGMGAVWLARRKDAGNQVAIKFLSHAALSPARRESFTREIRTLARLKHSYIAQFYDAGNLADGTPWFAMEYVEGARLNEYLRAQPRSIEERLRLFRAICEAVEYAHSQEIIHRDLKPSNILVQTNGSPKLLDFGIAKQIQSAYEPGDVTRPELRFRSRDYAAPEWERDGIVDFKTDVYSLGVILYEMLAQRSPGPASSKPPEKPSVVSPDKASLSKSNWADLDILCLKAMHVDPRERYRSVEAVIRDIDHYLQGEPLEARPDTLGYKARKFVARNRAAVLAASLAFASITALVTFFTLQVAKERDRANHEAAVVGATNRFLSDLLARTDPFKTGGAAQEPFADVVKQASQGIDARFKTEPLIAARLHGILAKAFDNRSDFPEARKEYDRAHALFKEADGSLSQDAIVYGLQRAAMEARSYSKGSLDLARSMLTDAEASYARLTHPRKDIQVWLDQTRGLIAIAANDMASADRSFSAALRGAQTSGEFDEAAQVRLKQMIAFCYTHQGKAAKAEPLFRDLIASLSKTEAPTNADLLRIRTYLAQSLYAQSKFAEAITEVNTAYPAVVQKLGEDHEVTLTLLGTKAASEGSLGMWDEAIRDDQTAYRLAAKKLGPVSFFSIAMLSDTGLSECLRGQFVPGEASARRAFDLAMHTYGAKNGLTGGTAFALATCLIGLNRLREASELLSAIDAKATAEAAGVATIGASISLSQAEIAAKSGDYARADRLFRLAAAVLDQPLAPVADKLQLARVKGALDSRASER